MNRSPSAAVRVRRSTAEEQGLPQAMPGIRNMKENSNRRVQAGIFLLILIRQIQALLLFYLVSGANWLRELYFSGISSAAFILLDRWEKHLDYRIQLFRRSNNT